MFKAMLLYIQVVICLLFSGCNGIDKNKIEVQSDIEFVQTKFPKIEDIESVKYYYQKISKNGEIGLEHIVFVGFLQIGDGFLKKIEKEYEWKKTKQSKEIIPKFNFSDERSVKYNFLYSYEFSHDGKYKSHSSTGNFYLDVKEKMLYFEVEYS